ncbi:zinc metalloprotease HtpX [Candidatus Woesearchaeota archaeon]|nr:zinc metalloprotease HtpX [Candidatus Woesearchaeota archaeon]
MINQIKTVLLLGGLSGLLLLIGSLIGGQQGLFIALAFSLLMNFGAYWFSDKIVLAMYRAKEVSRSQAPQLHSIIEEICKKANLPKPKIYIVPTDTPNAFATGRNPKHAAVAATEGILKILNKNELRGVLAHELGHVQNRDILITTIAATIASVISYIAYMARFAAMFGDSRNNDRGSSGIIGLLLLSILAPIAALILQLAISRSREYLADETGANTLHDSESLALALEKIERSVKINPLRFGNVATSSLFIVNPFSGQAFIKLFSTHPSTHERAKRLRAMKF